MKHPVLLLLLACVLATPYAAGGETGADRLDSKALEHLEEGRGHARAKLYPRALGDLRVAVAMAEQVSDTNLTLALALHNLAEVYRLNGEPANALQAYRRALRIYEELNHESGAAIAQRQIRTLLSGSKDVATGQQSDELSATDTAPAEKRLNRINNAVERIRKRLRSTDSTPPAAPSQRTSGSIRLSTVEGSSLGPNRRAYAEAVREKIQRGWQYPVSSKNKHQEGTVELEFALLNTGEIDSIKVLKSSGFLPLDMESIRSVREAAPYGPVALPPGQTQINLRLLFSYTLPTPEPNRLKAQAPGPPLSDQ